jgi:hypothetical protein
VSGCAVLERNATMVAQSMVMPTSYGLQQLQTTTRGRCLAAGNVAGGRKSAELAVARCASAEAGGAAIG